MRLKAKRNDWPNSANGTPSLTSATGHGYIPGYIIIHKSCYRWNNLFGQRLQLNTMPPDSPVRRRSSFRSKQCNHGRTGQLELNPVSVMEFYWRSLVVENVSFSRSLSVLIVLFSMLLLLTDTLFYHFFLVSATNIGPLMTRMGA